MSPCRARPTCLVGRDNDFRQPVITRLSVVWYYIQPSDNIGHSSSYNLTKYIRFITITGMHWVCFVSLLGKRGCTVLDVIKSYDYDDGACLSVAINDGFGTYLYRHEIIEVEWRTYVSVIWNIFASYNGLSPVWHQAYIWTNADILLAGALETNFKKKIEARVSNSYWSILDWKFLLQNCGHIFPVF